MILYKELPRITKVIKVRRLKLACHLIRHNNIMVHKLILWKTTNGRSRRDRKDIIYVDNLKEDSRLDHINEMMAMLLHRDGGVYKKYLMHIY